MGRSATSDEHTVSRQRGPARDVLDWISWMQHVCWVTDLCDTTTTAISVFKCFKQSASATRGSYIEGIKTV